MDSTTDREPTAPIRAPARLGRYTVGTALGRGVHGLVVAAVDPKFDREVAIKISIGGDRLQREAKALAMLDHPNVVTVHDLGVQGQLHYLVMARVRGKPLAEIVKRQPLPWREAVQLFIQVGQGLAAVHEAGIVHGDVKPANIIVDDRRAVLVDFGMACRADDPSARNWGGSLTYFAPERLRGEPPIAAAEQFAFCVSLWETILGSRPWPRERLADLVADVGAPTVRSPGADVPAALVRVLRRGLAADPRQRFENMSTLVDALAQVLTAPDRRRSQWVSILLGLAAALAVLGLERCL